MDGNGQIIDLEGNKTSVTMDKGILSQ